MKRKWVDLDGTGSNKNSKKDHGDLPSCRGLGVKAKGQITGSKCVKQEAIPDYNLEYVCSMEETKGGLRVGKLSQKICDFNSRRVSILEIQALTPETLKPIHHPNVMKVIAVLDQTHIAVEESTTLRCWLEKRIAIFRTNLQWRNKKSSWWEFIVEDLRIIFRQASRALSELLSHDVGAYGLQKLDENGILITTEQLVKLLPCQRSRPTIVFIQDLFSLMQNIVGLPFGITVPNVISDPGFVFCYEFSDLACWYTNENLNSIKHRSLLDPPFVWSAYERYMFIHKVIDLIDRGIIPHFEFCHEMEKAAARYCVGSWYQLLPNGIIKTVIDHNPSSTQSQSQSSVSSYPPNNQSAGPPCQQGYTPLFDHNSSSSINSQSNYYNSSQNNPFLEPYSCPQSYPPKNQSAGPPYQQGYTPVFDHNSSSSINSQSNYYNSSQNNHYLEPSISYSCPQSYPPKNQSAGPPFQQGYTPPFYHNSSSSVNSHSSQSNYYNSSQKSYPYKQPDCPSYQQAYTDQKGSCAYKTPPRSYCSPQTNTFCTPPSNISLTSPNPPTPSPSSIKGLKILPRKIYNVYRHYQENCPKDSRNTMSFGDYEYS